MTTPEHFRTRQRIEGLFLLVLAVFTVWQGVHYNTKQQDTLDCIRSNFAQLSNALQARADLANQDAVLDKKQAALDRGLWLINARAAGVLKDPGGKLTHEQQLKYQIAFVNKLLKYKTKTHQIKVERAQIAKERAQHPLPPLPPGTCE